MNRLTLSTFSVSTRCTICQFLFQLRKSFNCQNFYEFSKLVRFLWGTTQSKLVLHSVYANFYPKLYTMMLYVKNNLLDRRRMSLTMASMSSALTASISKLARRCSFFILSAYKNIWCRNKRSAEDQISEEFTRASYNNNNVRLYAETGKTSSTSSSTTNDNECHSKRISLDF